MTRRISGLLSRKGTKSLEAFSRTGQTGPSSGGVLLRYVDVSNTWDPAGQDPGDTGIPFGT